jgi:dipeptidyl aminopeptidase/acylaminoacyl peptidase
VATHHVPLRKPPMAQRQVTANPAGHGVNGAAISPDGKYLAYSDSSDGTRIAFTAARTGIGESHVGYLRAFGDRTIWLVGTNGQDPRMLAEGDQGTGFMQVVWSPDGSRIAYLKAICSLAQRHTAARSALAGRSSAHSHAAPATRPDPLILRFCDLHLVRRLTEEPCNSVNTPSGLSQ